MVPENDDLGMSESFLNITTSWEKKEKNMKIFLFFLMFVRKKNAHINGKGTALLETVFHLFLAGTAAKKGTAVL